ncbi:hypothetical protein [Trebonia sp.]|uniref:hypothetical protein n=1 Tax=Trebonia sp. TaxID=2767075 RepID=UPI002636195B|nr:hypothetical protein [Trebonia sp.]
MPVVQPETARRRSDAGTVRLSGRDVAGLILCAEQYAAPYDLLAAGLGVRPARLRGIVARWRAAGYAATGTLGPGPAWCWLTGAGMAACGLGYLARPPALARLAHIRAVLAVRLWLESGQAYADGRAWWRSERRIRAGLPSNADFRTGTWTLGSCELEAEVASAPPGDGGVVGQGGVAEDG